MYAIQWAIDFQKIGHDKEINSDVFQRLHRENKLPLGTLVPQNNHWISNAFVAESSRDGYAVLIIDDHYRGDDPAYRSESGVIGDEISRRVLCSLPAQARSKAVIIDPVVAQLIKSQCANGGFSSF